MEDSREVIETIRSLTGESPFDLAVILGSGLGAVADPVEEAVSFSYRDFRCFPAATVPGHGGRLVAGLLEGCRVLLFQGRFHIYQGLEAREVTLPVRIARDLGCPRLLLTNAAGGINPGYRPGDFMFVADHLNFMGDNPLRGPTPDPFLDLSGLYRQELFPELAEFARTEGIGLHQGVLAALPGPSYETPAEIRALRMLGADAVSMSTVPEAIMGKYLGMEVMALSLIANFAAGLSECPLTHQEVLETGRQGARKLFLLIRRIINGWCRPD